VTNNSRTRDDLAGEKSCIYCGAGQDRLQKLNSEAEFRGGVASYYYRCSECKQYFVEYWVSREVKTVLGS
jgi:hypothetical protein